RELKVWAGLQHINVVPLLGVVSGFGLLPAMVSPWFKNGSLSSYLARDKEMDISDKEHLLCGIAAGLGYLHSQKVVHGDLHSDNVLVDDDGRACLTDFGLSLIVQEFEGTSYLKSSVCGAIRFADPELVRRAHANSNIVYPTKPSDIYSFGGLMLHVLSGQKPYEGIKDFPLLTLILGKTNQPMSINDEQISHEHLSLIRQCWNHEEEKRPSADQIESFLRSQ
ncbi:kinase-like protein, partial [Melanogaster broomeanus]